MGDTLILMLWSKNGVKVFDVIDFRFNNTFNKISKRFNLWTHVFILLKKKQICCRNQYKKKLQSKKKLLNGEFQ